VTAEVDVFGVFLNCALVAAALAAVIHALLRPWLKRAGFYDLVWHRNLADICLFVLLWGAASALLPFVVTTLAFLGRPL